MQLFVKDLTVIDASYLCPKRGMVGESWIVDVILTGGLDSQNMVLDFGLVKKLLKRLIDDEVDHKLLVPLHAQQVQTQAKTNGMRSISMDTAKGGIHLYTPEQGVALLPTANIHPDSVRDYLVELIEKTLPVNINQVELKLREEVIPTASYHYSHGLKKHNGNCQRIAHGHRSMIEIWHDGSRDDALEQRWAKRWQDIYLGSNEDQIEVAQLNLSQWASELSEQTHYGFRYTAEQGLFELAIPKDVVELIDSDTTVECLAEYIMQALKAEHQLTTPLTVFAYEGVGKGAIAQDDH